LLHFFRFSSRLHEVLLLNFSLHKEVFLREPNSKLKMLGSAMVLLVFVSVVAAVAFG